MAPCSLLSHIDTRWVITDYGDERYFQAIDFTATLTKTMTVLDATSIELLN